MFITYLIDQYSVNCVSNGGYRPVVDIITSLQQQTIHQQLLYMHVYVYIVHVPGMCACVCSRDGVKHLELKS